MNVMNDRFSLGRYPPDLRAEAVKLVLEQAEALCVEWAT